MCGLKSTQCANRSGKEKFPPIPHGAPYIQVLHVSNNHWIAVSNINVTSTIPYQKNACIYDSGFSTKIDLKTKELICGFVKPESDVFMFDIMNVHSQPNLTDCGLFALAFATELVHGEDPVLCSFDCSAMRLHLLQCLEAGFVERFPRKKLRRVPFGSRVKKPSREPIFCTCRMPNNKEKAMIECNNCKKWYHKECEGVNTDEKYTGKPWKCSTCIDFVKSLC